jgi:predicted transcriptional regulator of viral defense system
VIVPIDAGVRGSESFIIHDFVIASHLASPYYIGFWSALNHHGLTDQIPRTVFVATTRPRKPLKILSSTFRFVQLAPKTFIGIETAKFDGAEVRISSKEKTLVDCLDHPELAGGIEEVARAVYFNHRGLDWGKVRTFGRTTSSTRPRRRRSRALTPTIRNSRSPSSARGASSRRSSR